MANEQCYHELEDFQLKLGAIRASFTKYVDENPTLLEITDSNYENYFK